MKRDLMIAALSMACTTVPFVAPTFYRWHQQDVAIARPCPAGVAVSQTSGGQSSGNVVVLDGGEVVISGEGNEASVVINGKAAKK